MSLPPSQGLLAPTQASKLTDCRCFFCWTGRTVLSSSAIVGALAEAHIVGYAPNLAVAVAADGGTADTGGTSSHDKPSRSANSVFTPTNERRRSAHCAYSGCMPR